MKQIEQKRKYAGVCTQYKTKNSITKHFFAGFDTQPIKCATLFGGNIMIVY